ncbi:DinB family protein [Tessaracoccus sp. MC1865]|uniref:DinB family protein n=1 Tax=Tessaracoccus sp. MC1865 TaxID=2760310 RepID=UPI0015FFC533|nr:DinB family protein [Tessaracoccus sp. MC1865]MBB1483552.1 DinB family protein [Tessaracoccus sp. MC1865]QTO36639.1 DinB family protein [Tessaracoccus sp. MC1865]
MDIKAALHRQLRLQREALLWKAEGLDERDLRLPRTPTGTNLLGLIKHCLGVEHGYFLTSMGRASQLKLPEIDFEQDPNGDFYATEDERADELIELYRAVAVEVDQAIDELELDAPGTVEWWGERGATTLGFLLAHVLGDIARHAGHADILREGIDGRLGVTVDNSNMWEPDGGWDTHVLRLTGIAEGFSPQ